MVEAHQACDISARTAQRLKKFDHLRGTGAEHPIEFWDFVVLTAIDDVQKHSYELQLQKKKELKELPRSARYVVFSDPPGPKIGNGGSTLHVLDQLVGQFGDDILDKKIIIVHAGGFSQRLPSASILGKVFLGIPVGLPMYQALELKLATYIDFPSKIFCGGVFVCSADTIEVYDDKDIDWEFAPDGFTALAHLSPVSIGLTHGVFVLDRPISGSKIVWSCKKFLHKPSMEQMLSTQNCVVHEGATKWVMTDSAFFISKKTAKKLLMFYKSASPITCEIDAYGDFLQALGHESSPSYTSNTKNVCKETESLVQTRLTIYNLLKDSPLQAIVLAPMPKFFACKAVPDRIPTSVFFHIGTMPEYLTNFCGDEVFKKTIGVKALASCSGVPFLYTNAQNPKHGATVVKFNRKGGLSCSMDQAKCNTPCIMGSVIRSNVSVGGNTVIEYCFLGENVMIGNNSIISNCDVPPSAKIRDGVFMHTAPISSDGNLMYVTIVFDVHADLKKSLPTSSGLECLKYFDKTLKSISYSHQYDFISLWDAKLFKAGRTMVESCMKACKMLYDLETAHSLGFNEGEKTYSMKDVLQSKDLQGVLDFRQRLRCRIKGEDAANIFPPPQFMEN